MDLVQLLLRFTILVYTNGGVCLKLRAKRGRNQKGFCFVSSESLDPSVKTCRLTFSTSLVYSDIRTSEKVPNGIIILDERIFDILECNDEDEIDVSTLSVKIPICSELHLDVISKRNLQNGIVAKAISERIDDFQEHFEGLILHPGQEYLVSELGICFVIKYLSPTDPSTNAARIIWKNLLKIKLGTSESQPSNLCIIVEVAAATQIVDVRTGNNAGEGSYVTRHQAILKALEVFEGKFSGYGTDIQFAGFIFSDEILPFITFDTQTGEEREITIYHSSSLIGVFRKWLDAALDKFSNRPSNPGAALKYGLELAHSLSENNDLPTVIIFFSSGIYSAGQNPVKIARTNVEGNAVKVLCISVGENSATDIMEAIAKEGNGIAFHLDNEDKMNLIVDAINEMTTSLR
jgi:hypothetical protein